ncbi:MAG: response regulator, partial [Flavobacteriaceae bacterium]|nr:response regulator [Flavobacteriaceae bacterium]
GTYGNGIYKLVRGHQGEATLSRDPKIGFPDNLNILDLFLDSKNRLWAGSYGQGLFCYDRAAQKTLQHVTDKNNGKALHYNDVLSIHQDYLGVLWFGTDGAGVSYYDEHLEKFNSLTNNQTPKDIHVDVVRALATDDSGAIWVGTSGKGLTKYHPDTKQWESYNSNNSALSSDRIISLFMDDDKTLWIGTQGAGLFLLDARGKITPYDAATESGYLGTSTIWSIFKDREGIIWLGTRDHGLIRFDKEEGIVEQYGTSGGKKHLPSNNIKVIAQDETGNLWLGTESNGVIKLDKRTGGTEHFSTSSAQGKLTTNAIKSLYIDNNRNKVWIGTYGKGVDVLDIASKKVENYAMAEGLPNNVIYAILPDGKGNLWLSSNKGISRLRPSPIGPQITHYNNYDGLATEFNTGAWHKADNGTLFFGGLDGLYWFDPDLIEADREVPKTNITKFEVLDQEFPLNTYPVLDHDQNTVALTFSSMQFSLPFRNQYRYRLLDYDKKWISPGNKNYVRYPKLPPGSYEFQVMSSNYDGIWGDNVAKFPFQVKSPWYWNGISKVFYGSLFLTLLYLLYAYLKWRWKMHMDLQLKEEETVRLKKLNDFRSRLYTNIAHEFKTPLTLISAPLDEQLSQLQKKGADNKKLGIVTRNVKRLTLLVDQLLHLAKLEEGKHQKKAIHGDIALFLRSLIASFEFQAAQKPIKLASKIKPMPYAWYDEDMLEKVVGNLLGNALKYAPKNSICTIRAHQEKDVLSIKIGNTINGQIDPEQLFERFYQESPSQEGMGIGLALVKELVQLYNGTIQVKRQKSNIWFLVRLDVSKSAFTHNELINPTFVNGTISDDVDFEEKNVPHQRERPLLLIVEDDGDTRKYIANSLKDQYQILTAKNGQEGFEKAVSKWPDIIISDVKMPILDGAALCERLKNDSRTSHIPILLLTGSSSGQKELEALRAGADDYIFKPFKTPVLAQRVHNLVSIRRKLAQRYAQDLVLRPKNVELPLVEDQFLKNIQAVLDQHLTDPLFNATEMGKQAGMSRMQLHRKLQSYTGLSTTAFIRSQRLKLASRILLDHHMTINEVAYAAGFNTPDYFMKCFKAQFNLTPSEFLKKHRKDKDSVT